MTGGFIQRILAPSLTHNLIFLSRKKTWGQRHGRNEVKKEDRNLFTCQQGGVKMSIFRLVTAHLGLNMLTLKSSYIKCHYIITKTSVELRAFNSTRPKLPKR